MFALVPLMLVAAVAIKLTSKGSIIFGRIAPGRGRPFRIYKFRTIIPDAEAKKMTPERAGRPGFQDQERPARCTQIGRFLRKTSIDEFPRSFGTCCAGDMTLVGPRPLPVSESDACEGGNAAAWM